MKTLYISGRVRIDEVFFRTVWACLTTFSPFRFAERVAELESEVKSLETQLAEQESEATQAISQWQDSCAAAEEKATELERKLEAAEQQHASPAADSTDATDLFTSDPPKPDDSELLEKLRSAEAELQDAKETLARDEDVVRQWEGQYISRIVLPCLVWHSHTSIVNYRAGNRT